MNKDLNDLAEQLEEVWNDLQMEHLSLFGDLSRLDDETDRRLNTVQVLARKYYDIVRAIEKERQRLR